MKVQVFSDLHLDVLPIKPISIVDGIDAVIVAGDVCEGAVEAFGNLRRIVPMPIPILMVLGRHPVHGDRMVITTPLWWAFPDGKRACSLSRFYRLGPPAHLDDVCRMFDSHRPDGSEDEA